MQHSGVKENHHDSKGSEGKEYNDQNTHEHGKIAWTLKKTKKINEN